MRWLRRSIVVVAALALVAADAGSAGGERANREAAERDAAQLLTRLVLPTGAVPSAAEPAGDQHYLSRPGQVPAAVNLVDRHRWWMVPEDETDVSQFVHAHQPKGTRNVTEGVGDGIGISTDSLTFALPSVGRSLGTRWVVVALVNLPGDHTGIRVDAEVQWLVPRPAGERIPASVHALEVSVRRPNRPPTSDVTVTNPSRIRRFASLINRLETVQPGVFDCTGEADDPVVTFTFRAASEGPVLVRATQIISPGATGSCEPMTLTVTGHVLTPLLDGTSVVRAAQRLLGVRLPRG